MTSNVEQTLIRIIEDRFSELFQPTVYIPDDIVKSELARYVKPTKHTVEEIAQMYNRDHEIPVSRVRINSLLNELEAENEKIQIERKDGKKYIFKLD